MPLNKNINREPEKAMEYMEIDESMTYSYVRLGDGEILEREENGKYRSIKTKDIYIPVVISKEDKQKTMKGFINISEQDEDDNDFYNYGQNESDEHKRSWSLFGLKKH